jgi:hypothetical protein
MVRTREPVTVWYNGVEYTVFRVGDLANAVGKASQTVSYWHRNDVLPEPPFRNERGDRFYTSEMIAAVAAAVEKRGPNGVMDSQVFRQEVVDAWTALGFAVV